MSTRMLNFEAEQMTWECFAVQANELSPDGQIFPGNYTYVETLRNMIASARGAAILHMRDAPPDALWRAWRDTIQDLTQRDIYTGWDLLPAVSGLAKYIQQIQSLSEESYIAGLWETDLIPSLLWATQERKSKLATQHSNKLPRRNGRNPSWSWASVDDGNISFEEHGSGVERDIKGSAHIKPAKIVPLSGSTRFGQLSEGCLYLQGALGKAQVGSREDNDSPWSEFLRCRMRMEDPQTKELIGYFAPDEADIPIENIRFLPLRAWAGKTVLRDEFAGLALLPTGNIDADFGYREYRRVGIVRDIGIRKLAGYKNTYVAII